jgi:hypothetical protein
VQQTIDDYLTHDSKPHLAPALFNAEITVTNSGNVPGDHVILLFAKPPPAVAATESEGVPAQQLATFTRLAALQPGESRLVALPITAQHLAYASRNGTWVTAKGEWALQVGEQRQPFLVS